MIVQDVSPAKPAPTPAMPPAEAIRRLAAAFRQCGFPRLYVAHADEISVLSVAADLTIWRHRDTFRWSARGRWLAQRAHAPEATALMIVGQRGHEPY